MNLRWNGELHRFEAELGSGGFRADLEAVKAAGFKCDGPPSWVWHSAKALPLKYLREHRPPVLTIQDDARAQYERLLPIEEKNQEVRAELKKAKKEIRKQQAKVERQAELVEICIPHKPGELYDFLGAEDLPPMPPRENAYVRPPSPTVLCYVCKEPVYEFEYAEGTENPACLWCQKIVLDGDEEIC